MTHESEATLEDRLEDVLVEAYGRDAVTRQHIYHTGRRVDLLVDVGLVTIAIECENDAESVIAGVGQALFYANHDAYGRVVPAVVVPDGHVPTDPERAYLEEAVAIYEESEILERLAGEHSY